MTAGNDNGGFGKNGPSGDGSEASPVVGMDQQTFRNFLTRALSGDETVPANILTRMNAAVAQHGSESKKRGVDWWERLFWQQAIEERLKEIDRMVGRYNKMADWHHDQAKKARGKMQEAADRLGEIGIFVDGVDEVLKEKERTGKFDREKAIELLRSRGVALNGDEDEQTLIKKLMSEEQKAEEERRKWSEQYGTSSAAEKRHTEMEEECRRKAQELVEKRDAIRSNGYEPEQEERQLRRISEEYKADIQIKAAEIEKLRGAADQEKKIKTTSQHTWEQSQSSQAETQASDFEALAGELTGKFQQAATNITPEGPDVPPVPRGPGAGAPSIRA